MTPAAYLVSARRIPGARKGGRLAAWHPADLAACVIEAVVAEAGADPAAIDDVILGCVSQVGEQASNIARMAVLASGLPEQVPGTTVDRQCGSSQQALHFAVQAVLAGSQDLVLAGGVESMTRVPMFSPNALAARAGLGDAVSPAVRRRFGVEGFSQFSGAEQLARRHGLDRGRLDAYALQSHQRAHAAETAGAFAAEKLAVGLQPPGGEPPGADRHADAAHERDEGVRADTSAERLAALQPITPGSVITAGNASQISDGASAVLVASEQGLRRLGRAPLARVVALDVVGGDPVVMLDAPIAATARVLRKAGLALGDIDLFEVNEAFACVPLAWLAATGADPERLNVHGGAIALGHPLGATGTRLTATLVHALHRRRGRYGLQTLCEGGGMANALVLEALL